MCCHLRAERPVFLLVNNDFTVTDIAVTSVFTLKPGTLSLLIKYLFPTIHKYFRMAKEEHNNRFASVCSQSTTTGTQVYVRSEVTEHVLNVWRSCPLRRKTIRGNHEEALEPRQSPSESTGLHTVLISEPLVVTCPAAGVGSTRGRCCSLAAPTQTWSQRRGRRWMEVFTFKWRHGWGRPVLGLVGVI